MHGVDSPSLTVDEFQQALEKAAEKNQGNDRNTAILKELFLYAQQL